MTEEIDPIDVHVGLRLRARRHEKGLSQTGLGDQLGVSFQQVQKYERGANRLSASTMHRAAGALGVPVSYFFEGLPAAGDPESVNEVATRLFANSPLGRALVEAGSMVDQDIVRGHLTLLRRQAGERYQIVARQRDRSAREHLGLG